MWMGYAFKIFLSLGLGYVLCVVAKKEKGLLKTLGYTLGISILVLSLLYGLAASCPKLSSICGLGKSMSSLCPASKLCPFAK